MEARRGRRGREWEERKRMLEGWERMERRIGYGEGWCERKLGAAWSRSGSRVPETSNVSTGVEEHQRKRRTAPGVSRSIPLSSASRTLR